MKTVSINGIDLSYTETGQGLPCLVMHGGLGLDHTYLHPSLDPLGDGLRLVYYDHRGHGRSGRPPFSTLTFEQFAEDADALRHHLGVESLAVIGHSVGGFVALEYATRFPDRVSHLILLNTGPAWITREEMAAQARRKQAESLIMPQFDRLSDLNSDQAVLEAFSTLLPFYFHRFDPAVAQQLTARMILHGAATGHGFRLLQSRSWLSHLSAITAATLTIAGRHDLCFSIEQAEQLQKHIPCNNLVIFEESGHFPFLEEPERFFSTMRQWLLRTAPTFPSRPQSFPSIKRSAG